MFGRYANHRSTSNEIPLDYLPPQRIEEAVALLMLIRAGAAPEYFHPAAPSGRVILDLEHAGYVHLKREFDDGAIWLVLGVRP